MDALPTYYCPICETRIDNRKVVGPNLDSSITPSHADGSFPCPGGGEPILVCDHANVDGCRAEGCPGRLESARWAPSIRSPHGEEQTRAYRGLILVVRLPPSYPSWAAYQDTARRVYVNGGQAATIRDAERRALQGIDDDFHDVAPPCLTGMGCLCAGHARGDAPQVRCDTTEDPGARPESAPTVPSRPTIAADAELIVDLALTPTRAQWRELRHVADVCDRGRAAQTAGSSRTSGILIRRGWVRHVDGYKITTAGRAALARAERRYLKHAGASS